MAKNKVFSPLLDKIRYFTSLPAKFCSLWLTDDRQRRKQSTAPLGGGKINLLLSGRKHTQITNELQRGHALAHPFIRGACLSSPLPIYTQASKRRLRSCEVG